MNTKSLYPIIIPEDFEKSIAFYKDVMGFDVKHSTTRKDGGRIVVLSNPAEAEIEFMEKSTAGPVILQPGFYGFRMNIDDMDAAIPELKQAGCEIVAGPFETAFGKNLIIKDSNGINITLIQHIKK